MAGMPNVRYFPGWPGLGISFCRTGCGRYVSVFNSTCRRSRRSCKPSSNSSRVSPSTPPAPLLRRTFSQAGKRFSGLYTLSTNEWTFLASVGFSQSLSLLGREVPGFSLMELILPRVLAPLIFQRPPNTFAGRHLWPYANEGSSPWLYPSFPTSCPCRVLHVCTLRPARHYPRLWI